LYESFTLAWDLFGEFEAICAQQGDRTTLARYHWCIGRVALWGEDEVRARDLFTEGVALAEQAGDRWALAQEIEGLGWLALNQDDLAEARRFCEVSEAHFRAVRDWRAIAWSLHLLGMIASRQGDYAAARLYLDEAVALNRQLRDKRLTGVALRELSTVARNEGDIHASRACLEEHLRLSREIGDTRLEGTALCALGWLARSQGKRAEAYSLVQAGIAKTAGVSNVDDFGNGLIVAAILAADEANYLRAMRLLGRAEAVGLGRQRMPKDLRRAYEESILAARKALGDVAVDEALADGKSMTQDQAVAMALDRDPTEQDGLVEERVFSYDR
jgi:tetratricopeptide (TPR) repeat protein